MTQSFTLTATQTFTITHAKHMAAKVATDLKRMQRFYGEPRNSQIDKYEAEIIELLKFGCVGTVFYGFRRNGNWIEPTLKYTARELAGGAANDDDPGKVGPGANIEGAFFYSFLTYSDVWSRMSPSDRVAIKDRLPFQREDAAEPGISGYLSNDLIYSSGGRALYRASVRSY